jgi:hypothetical protein
VVLSEYRLDKTNRDHLDNPNEKIFVNFLPIHPGSTHSFAGHREIFGACDEIPGIYTYESCQWTIGCPSAKEKATALD